jgi:Uma2 family endonuclease
MAPASAARLTSEDFLQLPEDGRHYELIEAELCVNPSGTPRHQIVAGNVAVALFMYIRQHGGGTVYIGPIDVVLDEHTVVEPDIIVISSERLAIVGPTNVEGAPDLIVEVVCDHTRRRDEITKRKLYEQHGVDEYWIVDPVIDLVKVYRRDGKTFTRVAEISVESGGTITTPLLPGFALDVHAIFGV